MSIALFDPSINSENIGDEIISDAVRREVEDIFPHEQIVSIPTQERIWRRGWRLSAEASERLVGGTNLLSSKMSKYKQWNIGLIDSLNLRSIILMGVGWWQYQEDPDLYCLRRSGRSKAVPTRYNAGPVSLTCFLNKKRLLIVVLL